MISIFFFTDLTFTLILDPRVTFSNTSMSREQTLKVKSDRNLGCHEFTLQISQKKINPLKAIDIDVKFENILHKIPENSKTFCETCFALDPRNPRSTSTKVSFSTGCKLEKCVSDLKLTRTLNFNGSFVLGSGKPIVIQFEISNFGEPAFLTKLNLSIPLNVTQFSNVPSSCTLDYNNKDMICDINNGKPIMQGQNVLFNISLDTSKLAGDSFVVSAVVASASDEKFPYDNVNNKDIFLTEDSKVESVG